MKLLRVHEAAHEQRLTREPGQVLQVDAAGVDRRVRRAARVLRLEEVQPESRRAMPAAAWAQGARLRPGVRLG